MVYISSRVPRPASAKRTSATAAFRSPLLYARRPRSRLGNPVWLRRSGGRHRFRQASSPPVQARCFAATFPVSHPPAFIHARRTALIQSFLHDPSASTGPASSLTVPDHASVVREPNKLQKQAATAPEASGSVDSAGGWQRFGAVFHRLGGGTSWNGHSRIGLVFLIIRGELW